MRMWMAMAAVPGVAGCAASLLGSGPNMDESKPRVGLGGIGTGAAVTAQVSAAENRGGGSGEIDPGDEPLEDEPDLLDQNDDLSGERLLEDEGSLDGGLTGGELMEDDDLIQEDEGPGPGDLDPDDLIGEEDGPLGGEGLGASGGLTDADSEPLD